MYRVWGAAPATPPHPLPPTNHVPSRPRHCAKDHAGCTATSQKRKQPTRPARQKNFAKEPGLPLDQARPSTKPI